MKWYGYVAIGAISQLLGIDWIVMLLGLVVIVAIDISLQERRKG